MSLVKMKIKSFNLPHYFQSNRIVMVVLHVSHATDWVDARVVIGNSALASGKQVKYKMPYRIRINYDKFSFDARHPFLIFFFVGVVLTQKSMTKKSKSGKLAARSWPTMDFMTCRFRFQYQRLLSLFEFRFTFRLILCGAQFGSIWIKWYVAPIEWIENGIKSKWDGWSSNQKQWSSRSVVCE